MFSYEAIGIFINYCGQIIEIIGLLIIVVSVMISLVKLPMKLCTMERVRVYLAKRIIFALEFIIAGDILLATVATNLDDILRLGGIVLIRVVLGYSIQKEVNRM